MKVEISKHECYHLFAHLMFQSLVCLLLERSMNMGIIIVASFPNLYQFFSTVLYICSFSSSNLSAEWRKLCDCNKVLSLFPTPQ